MVDSAFQDPRAQARDVRDSGAAAQWRRGCDFAAEEVVDPAVGISITCNSKPSNSLVATGLVGGQRIQKETLTARGM